MPLNINKLKMERLIKSREEIINNFPSQWVLIGNPKIDDGQQSKSVINSLMEGIPLISGLNKKEVAAQTPKYRAEYKSISCIFTGKLEHKKWVL